MKVNTFQKINREGKRIAIVQAHFNEKITNGLRGGAVKALLESGVRDSDIEVFMVPGAVEIPIVCQKVARTKKFDGIVTLGAVIKGDTAHFDYVSKFACEGILRVSLKENLPISLGVLNTYDLAQAEYRSKDNENNKGYEAAMSLLEVLSLDIK